MPQYANSPQVYQKELTEISKKLMREYPILELSGGGWAVYELIKGKLVNMTQGSKEKGGGVSKADNENVDENVQWDDAVWDKHYEYSEYDLPVESDDDAVWIAERQHQKQLRSMEVDDNNEDEVGMKKSKRKVVKKPQKLPELFSSDEDDSSDNESVAEDLASHRRVVGLANMAKAKKRRATNKKEQTIKRRR